MNKKTIFGKVKGINKDLASITGAVASSDSVDRDGDVLVQEGWDLSNFKANPVILWSHNPFDLPIGKATNIGVQGSELIFDAQFAVAENDWARKVFDLMSGGFLNTFSVGFIPKESNEGKITKMELLEISVVNLPANPDASLSREFKGFLEEEQKLYGEMTKAAIEKAGRVLSEKNRTLIRVAIDSMKGSVSALDDLLNATEPTEKKPDEKEAPRTQKKIDPNVQALKVIDKAVEYLLQASKKNIK